MGRDPSEIRAEIAETRERVGEEVDALSYKTDLKARASDYVGEKRDAVASRLTGARAAVGSGVAAATPDGRQVGRAKDVAERNPLGLAVGGAAVGFLVGTLLPSTRVEDERVGTVADRVTSAAKETVQQAVDEGKQVAQEATQAAVETARERGREGGEELRDAAQERIGEVRRGV